MSEFQFLLVILDLLGLCWCAVKCGFVNPSDCHCINVGDDCSGCYIYEQNRTDIFINFEGDEPF